MICFSCAFIGACKDNRDCADGRYITLTNSALRTSEFREENPGNGKGRDIGYALVAGSREGANNVEACTITASDAITAFAVPNPNSSSQSQSVFSGLEAQRVTAPGRPPNLLRIGQFC